MKKRIVFLLLCFIGTFAAKVNAIAQRIDTFHWTPELEREFFKTDTVHLRGRIEGYSRDLDFKTLRMSKANTITGEDMPRSIAIAEDGSFALDYLDYYPQCNIMFMETNAGTFAIRCYTVPGEITEINITTNGTVSYVRRPGRSFARDNSLRHNFEKPIEKCFAMHQEPGQWKRMSEAVEETLPCLERALATADTLAKQHNYSAWEHHLARTYARMGYGLVIHHVSFHLATSLTSQQDDSIATAIRKEITAPESYAFMRQMPCNDPTMLVFSDTEYLVRYYQWSGPLYKGKEYKTDTDAQTAITGDSLVAAADMRILGTEKPSLLLEIVLVRDFALDIYWNFWKNDKDWRTVYEAKRSRISQPAFLAQLDSIYTKFLNTKSPVSQLPDGPITDAFRKILDKYKGKYVMVDFWGMRCGPCRGSIQSSLEMRQALRNHPNIEFVFINAAGESSREEYEAYISKYLDGEEVYEVSRDEFHQLMELFQFMSIPHYESFDRHGNRINKSLHYRSTAEDFLKNELEPLKEILKK